jgi:branched-chain amino acid transport system ATP-binding protein
VSGPALLELVCVSAGYGASDILRELDLRVPAGGVTCIVGPNGAGKSTVLRVVSGLLRPRRGDVRFEGASIAGASPRAILDLGIVQVPQERSLFQTMSVEENVRLGGYSLRDPALVARRMHRVAEWFPIVRERGREPAASLSGGQQKQVELARAMMLEPRLLLLDEPTMGLDPRARALMFETIGRLDQEGRTILLVEQNARSGLGLATDGIVMVGGRVRMAGPGREILDHPEIGDLYLGRAG